MRTTFLAALMIMLAGSTASAQVAGSQNPNPKPAPEKPIDNGPTTPGANNAYQGGGMTLQSAPGGAPPKPAATAPGQTPANIVPPK